MAKDLDKTTEAQADGVKHGWQLEFVTRLVSGLPLVECFLSLVK